MANHWPNLRVPPAGLKTGCDDNLAAESSATSWCETATVKIKATDEHRFAQMIFRICVSSVKSVAKILSP
jgi:hypothetical protein